MRGREWRPSRASAAFAARDTRPSPTWTRFAAGEERPSPTSARFASALEGGRASGERVTRAQVAVLLEHDNAHREDAHARSLTDAEYASVTVAIEQMLRVLGEAERGQ